MEVSEEEKEFLLKGRLTIVDQEFVCVSVCFEWGFLFQRDSPCSSHGWCLKGQMKGG